MKQSRVDHIKQHKFIWVGFVCVIAIALLLVLQDLVRSGMAELNPAAPLVSDPKQTGRVRVGEIESTDLAIRYQIGEEASKTIRFPGASYIKVHISRLDLLPGDTIKVSDPDGEQVFQNRHFYQKALSGAEPAELGVVIDKYARGYPENEIQSLMYGIDSTCGTNQRTDVEPAHRRGLLRDIASNRVPEISRCRQTADQRYLCLHWLARQRPEPRLHQRTLRHQPV
jgi:hypothetical protein